MSRQKIFAEGWGQPNHKGADETYHPDWKRHEEHWRQRAPDLSLFSPPIDTHAAGGASFAKTRGGSFPGQAINHHACIAYSHVFSKKDKVDLHSATLIRAVKNSLVGIERELCKEPRFIGAANSVSLCVMVRGAAFLISNGNDVVRMVRQGEDADSDAIISKPHYEQTCPSMLFKRPYRIAAVDIPDDQPLRFLLMNSNASAVNTDVMLKRSYSLKWPHQLSLQTARQLVTNVHLQNPDIPVSVVCGSAPVVSEKLTVMGLLTCQRQDKVMQTFEGCFVSELKRYLRHMSQQNLAADLSEGPNLCGYVVHEQEFDEQVGKLRQLFTEGPRAGSQTARVAEKFIALLNELRYSKPERADRLIWWFMNMALGLPIPSLRKRKLQVIRKARKKEKRGQTVKEQRNLLIAQCKSLFRLENAELQLKRLLFTSVVMSLALLFYTVAAVMTVKTVALTAPVWLVLLTLAASYMLLMGVGPVAYAAAYKLFRGDLLSRTGQKLLKLLAKEPEGMWLREEQHPNRVRFETEDEVACDKFVMPTIRRSDSSGLKPYKAAFLTNAFRQPNPSGVVMASQPQPRNRSQASSRSYAKMNNKP